jgi:hypothetical protein
MDEPTTPEPADDERTEEQRRLIASVEELRALLAQLSEQDRHRVLELAHSLAEDPGSEDGS